MMAGLPMFMLVAAQAAPPAQPAPAPEAQPASAAAPESCKATEPKDVKAETREIVVCAQKPEGYRIDPDVLAAQRAKKKGQSVGPRRPERYVDNSCQSVGPQGCIQGPAIDLLGAALMAANMAQKAAKGENVGKMFVTQPQSSDYQRYLDAKHEREVKESEKAATAYAKQVAEQKASQKQKADQTATNATAP
jgi:hypothetical protein